MAFEPRFHGAILFYALLSLVILLIYEFVINRIKIEQKGFYFKDPEISYKKVKNVFQPKSFLILFELSSLGSFFLYALLKYRGLRTWKEWFHRIIVFVLREVLYFVFGMSMMILIATIVKVMFGDFRPYFLDQCNVNVSSTFLESMNLTSQDQIPRMTWIPADMYNCTNTQKWNKTMNSYYSGHSSIVVMICVWVIIFLEKHRKYEKVDNIPGMDYFLSCIRITIQTFYMIMGILVSCTRVFYHYHHERDVIMGIFVGIVLGIILYLMTHNQVRPKTRNRYSMSDLYNPNNHVQLQRLNASQMV